MLLTLYIVIALSCEYNVQRCVTELTVIYSLGVINAYAAGNLSVTPRPSPQPTLRSPPLLATFPPSLPACTPYFAPPSLAPHARTFLPSSL